MDVYAQIIEEFSNIPYVKDWEEVQVLFRRAASAKPHHWLLPLHACESVGGDTARSIPMILAAACGHIGIVLVDDMLDADPRGEHMRVGESAAANMASALQATALAVIARSRLNAAAKLTAMKCANEMFLATAAGQYWDVSTLVSDEDTYWKIAGAKSSPFFATAFQLGALAGGASAGLAAQIGEVGKIYGEIIQIHDDLTDTLAQPAKPDWNAKRAPLPILFASLVDHPLRNRFNELRPNAGSHSNVLEEAQEILIRCGAASYCIYQLLGRYERAGELLSSLPLKRREVLENVIEEVVQPVRLLLREVDSAIAAAPADRG